MARQTVLVVEDDDAIRLSLRTYLIDAGHQVFVASDGVGAILHLIDHDVTVIVTDYRMDILGGDYWVRFLQRFCPDTPVFIISGYLGEEITVPYPVVAKPFNYALIEEWIARLPGAGARENDSEATS